MPLKEKIIKVAPISGNIGIIFISVCFFVALLNYNNSNYNYSIFNHFISELGHTGNSQLYYIFSLGLCVGGPLLGLFIMGLGFHLDNKIGYIASVIGVISSIACVFVGVFPADIYLRPHLLSALTFFYGNLLATIIFSIAIYTDQKNKIPNWYIIPSFLVVTAGFIFLSLPKDSVIEFFKDRNAYIRPDYWANPIFEWLVFFTLALWIILIARHLKIYNESNSN
ncbi:MAG: DUF998 domain-containing protein [Saprospiraceae bacterium]|nr:DUF998 domain-containing protein [Saprospiraceae bacterium]